MEIYILSKGRAGKQITWRSLPKSVQARTKIAVYPEELRSYAAYPTIPVDIEERGVGHKRQFLVDNCRSRRILMMDDDLVFAHRNPSDPTRFVPATDRDIEEMVLDIDGTLDIYPHVGVAPREGGNRNTETYLLCTRMMRVLAYDVTVLRELNIRFDQMQLMEDFDVTLHLLRRGKENCLLNYMVQNQAGSNASGGVSTYRTLERQEAAAQELARRHPRYVQVVKKVTKAAWGGGERTDVRVSWKKAYHESNQ